MDRAEQVARRSQLDAPQQWPLDGDRNGDIRLGRRSLRGQKAQQQRADHERSPAEEGRQQRKVRGVGHSGGSTKRRARGRIDSHHVEAARRNSAAIACTSSRRIGPIRRRSQSFRVRDYPERTILEAG
jgi:hypothetical protein